MHGQAYRIIRADLLCQDLEMALDRDVAAFDQRAAGFSRSKARRFRYYASRQSRFRNEHLSLSETARNGFNKRRPR